MADKKISALTGASTPLAGTEVLPIVQGGATVKVAVSDLTVGRAVSALTLASTTGATFASTSGNVGIGTLTPSRKLEVLGSGAMFNNSGGAFEALFGDAAYRYFGIYTPVNPDYIAIRYSTTQILKLDALTYDVTAPTGNFVPATAAKGINFTANTPAAGKTSQLLNWYEEGTWTPAYTGWTLDPTSAAGQYTRIGRTVVITLLGIGGTSTTGSITGLPFTSKSTQGATVTIRGTNSNINAVGAIIDSSATIDNIGTMTAGENYWALSGTYII